MKANPYHLTPREMEVLAHLTHGHSAKVIANAMFVSTSMIETHVNLIHKKMGVTSSLKAVCKAFREGLVEMESA